MNIKSSTILVSLFLSLLSFPCWANNAGIYNDQDAQQCIDSGVGNQAKGRAEELLALNAKIRVSSIKNSHFIVDVRSSNELGIDAFRIEGAVNVTLSQLKAKTYLSKQKLLLVGSGFNDEQLVKEAQFLERRGFRDVKVLANGVRSAALLNQRVNLSHNHYSVSSQIALSTAAMSALQAEFLFVGVGNDISVLEDYSLDYQNTDITEAAGLAEFIQTKQAELKHKNKHAKLVLVSNGFSENKTLSKQAWLVESESIWLLQGGVDALTIAVNTIKKTAKPAERIAVSCGQYSL